MVLMLVIKVLYIVSSDIMSILLTAITQCRKKHKHFLIILVFSRFHLKFAETTNKNYIVYGDICIFYTSFKKIKHAIHALERCVLNFFLK